MFRFKDYTTLLEGKADDLRQEFQAMPSHSHLVDLDNPTLVKFGQGLKKMSDVPQNIGDVRQTLDAFNKHGPKLAGNLKDFSQHPSFTHVQQALQPHIERAALKAQKKQAGVAGEETIHDDGQGTVVKEIHTPEAASQPKYCDGTAWCVSRQGESGKNHFEDYQGNGGTGKNGEARMFVIHTPDGEMYAHHEGEEGEDYVGETDYGSTGIIRNRQDHGISISKFISKYPQISKIKELQNTKYGKEFNAISTAIDSPERVSEILKNDKSPEKLIHKAIVSKHFNSSHVSEILNDPSKHHILYNVENPKHFTTDHLDHILDNSNKVETQIQSHILGKILDHTPEKLEPRHIDKLLESPSRPIYDPSRPEKNMDDYMQNNERYRMFFYQKEALKNAPAVLPRHIQHILDNKEKYHPELSELAVKESIKRYPLELFHNQSQ